VLLKAKSLSYEDRLEAAKECLAEGKTIGIINLLGLKQPIDTKGYKYRYDSMVAEFVKGVPPRMEKLEEIKRIEEEQRRIEELVDKLKDYADTLDKLFSDISELWERIDSEYKKIIEEMEKFEKDPYAIEFMISKLRNMIEDLRYYRGRWNALFTGFEQTYNKLNEIAPDVARTLPKELTEPLRQDLIVETIMKGVSELEQELSRKFVEYRKAWEEKSLGELRITIPETIRPDTMIHILRSVSTANIFLSFSPVLEGITYDKTILFKLSCDNLIYEGDLKKPVEIVDPYRLSNVIEPGKTITISGGEKGAKIVVDGMEFEGKVFHEDPYSVRIANRLLGEPHSEVVVDNMDVLRVMRDADYVRIGEGGTLIINNEYFAILDFVSTIAYEGVFRGNDLRYALPPFIWRAKRHDVRFIVYGKDQPILIETNVPEGMLDVYLAPSSLHEIPIIKEAYFYYELVPLDIPAHEILELMSMSEGVIYENNIWGVDTGRTLFYEVVLERGLRGFGYFAFKEEYFPDNIKRVARLINRIQYIRDEKGEKIYVFGGAILYKDKEKLEYMEKLRFDVESTLLRELVVETRVRRKLDGLVIRGNKLYGIVGKPPREREIEIETLPEAFEKAFGTGYFQSGFVRIFTPGTIAVYKTEKGEPVFLLRKEERYLGSYSWCVIVAQEW